MEDSWHPYTYQGLMCKLHMENFSFYSSHQILTLDLSKKLDRKKMLTIKLKKEKEIFYKNKVSEFYKKGLSLN